MANLILHDTTIRLIEQLKKQTPHALLLHSDQRIGLKSIALEIAGATAQLVAPDDGDTATIKVDTIRRLYEQTKGKTTKRQYFIIDDAEMMTNSAQSAFLKLLEEPTDNIVFILTSHQPDQLLETIRSRVQQFRIVPPEPTKVAAFINQLESDATEAKKLTFLAAGSPSRAAYYARNHNEFRNDAQYMTSAREFLTASSRYTKLTIALPYAKQRADALQFVANCIRLQRLGASQPVEYQRLADYLKIYDRLSSNANIKLALTQLVLK